MITLLSILLFTAVLFFLLFLLLLIHEFTHAIHFLKHGVKPDKIEIGIGPVVCQKSWKGTPVFFKAFPLEGEVDCSASALSTLNAVDRCRNVINAQIATTLTSTFYFAVAGVILAVFHAENIIAAMLLCSFIVAGMAGYVSALFNFLPISVDGANFWHYAHRLRR